MSDRISVKIKGKIKSEDGETIYTMDIIDKISGKKCMMRMRIVPHDDGSFDIDTDIEGECGWLTGRGSILPQVLDKVKDQL